MICFKPWGKSSDKIKMTKENLFLDYGGLIFNYDFNEKTLFRAHNLALACFNSMDLI